MVWNFRVIRRKAGGKDVYQLHRVFYLDPSRRLALYIEATPSSIVGEDAKLMLEDIELMTEAFSMPTIYIPEWNTQPEVTNG
jgi:hypothetical protein